jgi:hypothetical protein
VRGNIPERLLMCIPRWIVRVDSSMLSALL